MGSNNFFSKLASYDPLAHAMHLPGANKYMQAQATAAAGRSGAGPYAGVAPTLQASAAGYVPGGAGSNADWKPFVMPQIGSGWQRFSQTFNNDPAAKAIGAPGATNNGNPGLNGGGGPPSVSGPTNAGAGFVQASQKFAPRQVGGSAYGYGGY